MSDMTACLNNLSYIPPNNEQNEPTQGDIGETSNELTQAIRNEFEELYTNANEELYPSCDYMTRLEFIANLPILRLKGEDNKEKQLCPVCNTCRWKDNNTTGKKVPKKVLRYFLIIPRLQCLYKSSHTAKEMTKHATRKCMEPEPRNVRLGLAADGFNPFGKLSQSYSMWPVILTTYNLPSWLCMRESYLMLTLLIPGLKSPGMDIDVYLRPLIDDLKDLWALKGVETIDIATQIFSRTLMEADMVKAQSQVVDILCNLELIYPPAFFDVMIHLVIHLPQEALEGGPIPNRWIFKQLVLKICVEEDNKINEKADANSIEPNANMVGESSSKSKSNHKNKGKNGSGSRQKQSKDEKKDYTKKKSYNFKKVYHCWVCGKPGHKAKDCLHKKEHGGGNS
ncbi:hypothetical protein Tco_1124786 [Tanacetum coccineum]|uniref:CCHC-type domain-containing protein n=1 Tax=Tanacetum coccineum TaxID=301880 RepID=A0ABQ5J7R9_9ASTR